MFVFYSNCYSRFILNIPDEYKTDMIRTFFQIELAHWFYIDFFVPEIPGLKGIGIKDFAKQDILLYCINGWRQWSNWSIPRVVGEKYRIIFLPKFSGSGFRVLPLCLRLPWCSLCASHVTLCGSTVRYNSLAWHWHMAIACMISLTYNLNK